MKNNKEIAASGGIDLVIPRPGMARRPKPTKLSPFLEEEGGISQYYLSFLALAPYIYDVERP